MNPDGGKEAVILLGQADGSPACYQINCRNDHGLQARYRCPPEDFRPIPLELWEVQMAMRIDEWRPWIAHRIPTMRRPSWRMGWTDSARVVSQ